jgi:hypothetical protein
MRCDEWFVSDEGTLLGPLSERRINDLIRWGKLSERAFVADGDYSAWIPIQRSAFASAMAERSAQQASVHAPERPATKLSFVRSMSGMRDLLLALALAVSMVVFALAS